jgi:hypothetical protein
LEERHFDRAKQDELGCDPELCLLAPLSRYGVKGVWFFEPDGSQEIVEQIGRRSHL